ncbi:3-methyl-2-oxobutanoate dehydrogenase subunit delta [Palaeococcus ferrophilus]|uniref:3-methyl-2-oxobutanoate dehydrogenase subunit delta n=1 Tax=Palaeococcus ferrophilus TaxID=83868 RepID=UPI00064E88D0|nr:3-methyl-2-oxobutanoate dehydrogenase subunit delta [Palaeococcus ferrophilus]
MNTLFGKQKAEAKRMVFTTESEYPEAPVSLGTTLINFTGDWRTFIPKVDDSKCVKCYICWKFCPEPAIYIREDGYVGIDYDYCKGCGICANECPTKAITMEREEK